MTSGSIIHRAMDNFHHNENTLSGKGSNHDIILMIFQNSNTSVDNETVLQNSVNCNLE